MLPDRAPPYKFHSSTSFFLFFPLLVCHSRLLWNHTEEAWLDTTTATRTTEELVKVWDCASPGTWSRVEQCQESKSWTVRRAMGHFTHGKADCGLSCVPQADVLGRKSCAYATTAFITFYATVAGLLSWTSGNDTTWQKAVLWRTSHPQSAAAHFLSEHESSSLNYGASFCSEFLYIVRISLDLVPSQFGLWVYLWSSIHSFFSWIIEILLLF